VRRQVERREGAAREAVCPLEARWRKQRVEPVVAALRLQERELVEVADLAHGAIDGREDRLRPALDRASAGSQRAGEEFIEARIRERVRLRGLLQPRAVASNEGANQRVLDRRRAGAGEAVHRAREGVLRNEMLPSDEKPRAEPGAGEARAAGLPERAVNHGRREKALRAGDRAQTARRRTGP